MRHAHHVTISGRHEAQVAASPTDNRMLAGLPAGDLARLAPALELVDMPIGSLIYEPARPLTHVYFPTTSIVSLLYVLRDGASAEIAMTGRDGVVGISIFMGGGRPSSRAVVQTAGLAFRTEAATLREEFARNGALHDLALRYMHALIAQMSQTAVCNRHHDIAQQLCRWLLVSVDLTEQGELRITQELIASMLGVRREGVTEAAGKLQSAGIIKYRRGHITVLERDRLEARACECYGMVKAEYQRLLPYALNPDAADGDASPGSLHDATRAECWRP